MATQTVNFFQPGSEAGLDYGQVQRQRALADMLTKQGMTPQQGQMVGGIYVAPGGLSYASQLANALAGGFMQNRADQSERDILQQSQQRRAQEASDFLTAMSGKPGMTTPPIVPNDDEGNPMPAISTPGIAPDRNRALAIALQSSNPALQAMGGELMKRQMSEQELSDIMSKYGPGAATGGSASPAPGASSVSAPGSPGGMPGGVNPLAFALAASGRDKLGSMIQDASKPQILPEGSTYLDPITRQPIYVAPKTEVGMVPGRGPNGQLTFSVAPGYAEGKAKIEGAIAGARQGAESDNTIVTVRMPDGSEQQMTRAQARDMVNSTQTTRPRSNNPMAPRPEDNDRALIFQQERTKIASQLQDAAQRGDSAQVARLQQDALALEREIKSSKIPLEPMQVPGIAGQSPTQKKFGEQVASQSADALTAGRDKAKTAADDLLTIGQARKAINEGAYQGSGAETKLAIAKFINANVPGITVDADKVGNTDYLKSTLGEGLLAKAKTLGANPTNADAERINDIVGSIGKDPKAMTKLLDWREEMNRRAINSHNSTVDDAERRGLKSPFDLRVKPPSSGEARGQFRIIGVQ